MSEDERLFRNIVKKMVSTVKRNSKCRAKYEVVSCSVCQYWNECKANDWDALLKRKRELEQYVPNAWNIESEIRKNYNS